MPRAALRPLGSAVAIALALACSDGPRAALGPADGRDLPPADTGRVALADTAPDFTLASLDDGRITLSGYRGEKDVVLVFYRGHW